MNQAYLPLAEYICVDSLPSVPVCEHALLPKESGIYFVVSHDGIVQYIGRTSNLHARWNIHHRLDQYGKMPLFRIAWLAISNSELLPALEKAYIHYFQPKDNGNDLESDDHSLITIKTSKKVLQLLKLLAAHTGEKQYAIPERLLTAELATLQKTGE